MNQKITPNIFTGLHYVRMEARDGLYACIPQGEDAFLALSNEAQVVAVLRADGEWRLWQSVYAESDCPDAMHIWLAIGQDAFLHCLRRMVAPVWI